MATTQIAQGQNEPFWKYLQRRWAVWTGKPYVYDEMFGPPLPNDKFFNDQARKKTMVAAVLAGVVLLIFFGYRSSSS